jgi:uncharacterized membrane protein (UPF0127 family)
MRYVRVANTVRGTILGTRVAVADTWWLRLWGLLGRAALRPGEGLMLTPCRAVHMYGVRYPIDVAFVDRRGIVLSTYSTLAPGARTRWHGAAISALELPAGTLELSGTLEGDAIVWSSEQKA